MQRGWIDDTVPVVLEEAHEGRFDLQLADQQSWHGGRAYIIGAAAESL
jgi:hypothetical protein